MDFKTPLPAPDDIQLISDSEVEQLSEFPACGESTSGHGMRVWAIASGYLASDNIKYSMRP